MFRLVVLIPLIESTKSSHFQFISVVPNHQYNLSSQPLLLVFWVFHGLSNWIEYGAPIIVVDVPSPSWSSCSPSATLRMSRLLTNGFLYHHLRDLRPSGPFLAHWAPTRCGFDLTHLYIIVGFYISKGSCMWRAEVQFVKALNYHCGGVCCYVDIFCSVECTLRWRFQDLVPIFFSLFSFTLSNSKLLHSSSALSLRGGVRGSEGSTRMCEGDTRMCPCVWG